MRGEQQFRELRERYPDGVVPYGTWTVIAQELGCTPEWVRQLAVKLGFQVDRRPIAQARTCSSCGGRKSPSGRGTCHKCKLARTPMVDLVCRTCGESFKRPERKHTRLQSRPRPDFESLSYRYQRASTASSGPFCSWDCRNKKGKLQ